MYSTVRIEVEYSNVGTGSGTGYLMEFLKDEETGKFVPVLITNKHVIENASTGYLVFTRKGPDGKPLDNQHVRVVIPNFELAWTKHPDPNVDLCFMPIAFIINNYLENNEELFLCFLHVDLIPTNEQIEDLDMIEEVIMIGYPNGIWDHINNKPIFRKGITATHPKFDVYAKKEFTIDMACFPGSSGSPVLIFNQGGYTDKIGNTNIGTSRLLLLGTLYAGPQHNVVGEW